MSLLRRAFGQRPVPPEPTGPEEEIFEERRLRTARMQDCRSVLETANWLMTVGKSLEASILAESLSERLDGIDAELRAGEGAAPSGRAKETSGDPASRLAAASRTLSEIEARHIDAAAARPTPREAYEERLKAWRRRRFFTALYLLAALAALAFAGMRTYAFLGERFILPANVLTGAFPGKYQLGGLGPLESDGKGAFCWGMGPKTILAFAAVRPEKLEFRLGWENIVAGQTLIFRLNGVEIKRLGPLGAADSGELRLPLDIQGGLNALEIEYSLWNFHGALLAPEDSRPFALRLTAFSLRRAGFP